MTPSEPANRSLPADRVRFGDFELDLGTGDLLRAGSPVGIQAQPSRLLVLLVANAGRLVSRSQIVQHLWPDSIVEYDQGLNNTVRNLRMVLGDDPAEPRFIETVPRQGYRFVGSITPARGAGGASEARRGPWPARPLAWLGLCLLAGIAMRGLPPPRRPPAGSGEPTILVLPLTGAERDSRMIGESLASELTKELAVAAEGPVRVVGQASALRVASRGIPPAEAGRSLDATHVVHGSIVADSDRIRVQVELLEVEDGFILWTETREPSWAELLTAQRQIAGGIARRVVRSLHRLPANEGEPATIEPAAMEAYMRGRYLLTKGSPESALPHFQHAVDGAPDFARARVGLGQALLAAPSSVSRMQTARQASLEALRLDPLDPEAHLLRSRIALQHDWDWPAAEAHARRALELAPGVAEALLVQATWAISLGRTEEALELAREAKVLDPLSSVVAGDLAAFYFWSDDPLQVLRETAELLELEAETPVAMALRLDALFELERWDEARTLALRLVGEPRGLESASGEEVERSFLAGQHQAWLAVPESGERSMVLASVAARLGHRDEAIGHLQRAVELHCAYVPFLPIDPHLASLRGDTRFAAILEEVGHPLSSRSGGPVELAVGRHGTS